MTGGRPLPPALPGIAAAFVCAAFALACTLFVWQSTLATFADDSVSYLVMAQVFSPWQAASPAVAAEFPREAFYPPLYPLVLALSGAAGNTAWAHGLTALLLAAALPAAWLLGARWLGNKWAATAAIACIALLPSMWVNSKGILSETLFCLLLVSTFLYLEKNTGWKTTLLLAALALTRTAALPMLAAYGLWALTRRGTDLRARAIAAVPALAAIAAYGLWVLLRPSQTEDDYARLVLERGQGFFEGPGGFWAALAASLARQANALMEGWAGSLLVFWIEGRPLRFALASVAGLLALGGLVLRLARGKADGWMSAAYLATLLAWPFYEQMERFLFPLVPVLVLYAFLAAGEGLRSLGRPAAIAHALLATLLLTLAVPAMGFIYQRAQAGGPQAAITDWYRSPDIRRARARAQTHLDLLEDMQAIRSLTQPGDKVMWVAPSYLALLADRQGLAAPAKHPGPGEYRAAVKKSGADYVFLSRYHPRDTIRDSAWQAGLHALVTDAKPAEAKVVHTRALDGGSAVTSILLKVAK